MIEVWARRSEKEGLCELRTEVPCTTHATSLWGPCTLYSTHLSSSIGGHVGRRESTHQVRSRIFLGGNYWPSPMRIYRCHAIRGGRGILVLSTVLPPMITLLSGTCRFKASYTYIHTYPMEYFSILCTAELRGLLPISHGTFLTIRVVPRRHAEPISPYRILRQLSLLRRRFPLFFTLG